MKKIILFFLAAAILTSCDYKIEVHNWDVKLDLQVLDLRGNYVFAQVVPEDDHTMYLASVIKAEEYESKMSQMTEAEFQKEYLENVSEHYANWRKNWPGNTENYFADLVEHEYFFSTLNGYFLNLEPNTDYYFYAFCVNSSMASALGPIQKLKFTTPEYKPLTEGIDFDFMIYDTDESFYYYVRPSYQGKICFDAYFSTILKDSDIKSEKYEGDIRACLKDWLTDMGNDVEMFLTIDISRYQTILNLQEGEEYTLVACPYVNLGNGPLTIRRFTYKKGMKTSYSNDGVTN